MRPYDAKVARIVDKLLKKPEKYFESPDMLKYKEFLLILNEAIQNFKRFPNVITQTQQDPKFRSLLICGDTRGELHSTLKCVTPFLEGKVESMIFLGDYIDDGITSILNLAYLLSLSLAFPDRIVLLRGNHEDLDYNAMYGFGEALKQLFPKSSDYDSITSHLRLLYDHLPLAVITPQKSFCVHGGIPKNVDSLEPLLQIPKPHSKIEEIVDIELQEQIKSIFDELRWNDPIEKDLQEPDDKSYHRSNFYTQFQLYRFLQNTGFNRLIRSHESQRGSFEDMFEGSLLHVLSYKSEVSSSVSMGYYAGQTKMGYMINERNDGSTLLFDLDFNIVKKL